MSKELEEKPTRAVRIFFVIFGVLLLVIYFIWSKTAYYRVFVNKRTIHAMRNSKSSEKRTDWFRDVLDGCDLSHMELNDMLFDFAWMRNTNFAGSNLTGASLQYGILIEANFENTTLTRVNMQGAYLINANLRNSNLNQANLTAALLIGADLRGANLAGAKLTGSVYSHKTILPPNFHPEDHEMRLTETEQSYPQTPVWGWGGRRIY